MAYTQPLLSGLFQGLNGYLHGPVHIMIGGQWFYDGVDYDISEASHLVSDAYYDIVSQRLNSKSSLSLTITQQQLQLSGNYSMITSSFLLTSKYLWRQVRPCRKIHEQYQTLPMLLPPSFNATSRNSQMDAYNL